MGNGVRGGRGSVTVYNTFSFEALVPAWAPAQTVLGIVAFPFSEIVPRCYPVRFHPHRDIFTFQM